MWMKPQLERMLDSSTEVIGLGEEEAQGEIILKIFILVTNEGWEMDADWRHADIIVETVNWKEVKLVGSP